MDGRSYEMQICSKLVIPTAAPLSAKRGEQRQITLAIVTDVRNERIQGAKRFEARKCSGMI